MTEYTRDFGENGIYQAEVNNRHGGEFILYEGATKYFSFTANEALTILSFLQTHECFLQEAQQSEEENDEE